MIDGCIGRFDLVERVIVVAMIVVVVVVVLTARRTVAVCRDVRMHVRVTDQGVKPWPDERDTAEEGRKKPGKR